MTPSFQADLTAMIADQVGMDATEIAPDQLLMSSGILDSFGLVTVLSLVEEAVGREIAPADLTFENFDSVERILAFVERSRD